MKYKLEINVLRPIKDGELEIEPGITIIFGPTASGKSILLSTIAALLYKGYGKGFHDIIRELLERFPLREFNIKFNDLTFTNKRQVLEGLEEYKEMYPLVLYLPAFRIISYYLGYPMYENVVKDIVLKVIGGKTFSKAFREVLAIYIKKTFTYLHETLSKSIENTDEWLRELKKSSGYLHQLTSPLAQYSMTVYVMALGLIMLNPDLGNRVEKVFSKYFKDLGEIILSEYSMKYKHPSGYVSDIIESSDGIKEVNYYVVIREAFHDQVLFTIIDEVELHLYPRTLIGFLDYLLDSNRESNSYVLLSSHSLYTVAWGIKQIMNNQPVKLYIMKRRNDGYYELSEPDLEKPFEGFEDLYMELLLEHRRT